MFELQLIDEVKKYQCIYNKDNVDFRNKEIKESTWYKIESAVGQPEEKCRLRWKTLRERYVREHLKMTSKPKYKSIWRYTEAMSFLQEYVGPRTYCFSEEVKARKEINNLSCPKKFEDSLIDEVKKYPIIYDKEHPDFRNKQLKEEAWAEIAQCVSTSDHQCRNRWKTLRERAVSEHLKMIDGRGYKSHWRYTKAMSFMKFYLTPKANRKKEPVFKYTKRDMYCRTCLSQILNESGTERTLESHNIFATSTLAEMLKKCSNLQIEPWDEYPHSVCEKCYEKILDFHQFQQMCSDSLNRFSEILEDQTQVKYEYDYEETMDNNLTCLTDSTNISYIETFEENVTESSSPEPDEQLDYTNEALKDQIEVKSENENELGEMTSDDPLAEPSIYEERLKFDYTFELPHLANWSDDDELRTDERARRSRNTTKDSNEYTIRRNHLEKPSKHIAAYVKCQTAISDIPEDESDDEEEEISVVEPEDKSSENNTVFRWRIRKEDNYVRNKRKNKRNSGQEYFCPKTKKTVEARKLGPPCSCDQKCRQQLNNTHELIFNQFWELGSYDLQNSYLFGCIHVGKKKRSYKKKTKRPESRRNVSVRFLVDIDGVHVKVCKIEFMSLHGLQNSRGRLDHIIKIKKSGAVVPKEDGRDDSMSAGQIKTSGPQFACDICAKTFSSQYRLKAHRRKHMVLRDYPCTYGQCQRSFTRLELLQKHLDDHNSGLAFKCNIGDCERMYKNQYNLSQHKIKYHNRDAEKRYYVCEVCGKKFFFPLSLRNHRFTHLDKYQWPYVCDEEGCSQRFQRHYLYKLHKKRHAGIKNHICPYCGLRTITLAEMNRHINVHTFERKYPCHLCSKVSKSTADRRNHIRRVHDKSQVYPCSMCDGKFSSSYNRDHHEMSHRGIKPYSCDQCSKQFKWKMGLKMHKKIVHLGVQPYVCDVCGKEFGWYGSLTKHKRTHCQNDVAKAQQEVDTDEESVDNSVENVETLIEDESELLEYTFEIQSNEIESE